jgi:hypothetical protein
MCASPLLQEASGALSDMLMAISCRPFHPTLPTVTAGLAAVPLRGGGGVAGGGRAPLGREAAVWALHRLPDSAGASLLLTVKPDTRVKLVVVMNDTGGASSHACDGAGGGWGARGADSRG